MRDGADAWDGGRRPGWALPASVAVHLVLVVLLIVGLPISLPKPPKEETVAVEMVPPPKPPEKPPQEKPPASSKEPDAVRRTASSMLNPVFRYAEKNAGPRRAAEGAGTLADDQPRRPEAHETPEPATKGRNGAPPQLASTAPDSRAAPSTRNAAPGAAGRAKQPHRKLREAQKLFSQAATQDPLASSAMGDLPRGVRAGHLCVTELREQLRHASPPYSPELLPSYQLKSGDVLEVSRAAFRGSGQWYDLDFRCEVDAEATKVVAFALRVGDPLSSDERARRGLPSQ